MGFVGWHVKTVHVGSVYKYVSKFMIENIK